LHGINRDQTRLDGSKKPSKKGVQRRALSKFAKVF
jgi:hypothetical protein